MDTSKNAAIAIKAINTYQDEIRNHGNREVAQQHSTWATANSAIGRESTYKHSWHVSNEAISAYQKHAQQLPHEKARDTAVAEVVKSFKDRGQEHARPSRGRSSGMEL